MTWIQNSITTHNAIGCWCLMVKRYKIFRFKSGLDLVFWITGFSGLAQAMRECAQALVGLYWIYLAQSKPLIMMTYVSL